MRNNDEIKTAQHKVGIPFSRCNLRQLSRTIKASRQNRTEIWGETCFMKFWSLSKNFSSQTFRYHFRWIQLVTIVLHLQLWPWNRTGDVRHAAKELLCKMLFLKLTFRPGISVPSPNSLALLPAYCWSHFEECEYLVISSTALFCAKTSWQWLNVCMTWFLTFLVRHRVCSSTECRQLPPLTDNITSTCVEIITI